MTKDYRVSIYVKNLKKVDYIVQAGSDKEARKLGMKRYINTHNLIHVIRIEATPI